MEPRLNSIFFETSTIIYLGIFSLLFFIFMIIVQWKIFVKAGKPGWAAIIPIYNLIILLEIVGKPSWWFILMIIPLVNVVFMILITHELSLSFGKDVGFTIGLIFLGIVFYPLLAFGDARYLGPGGGEFDFENA